MTKKLFLFVFTLLSTLTASAYDAEINGIYYNFYSPTKEATVTHGTKYTGIVNIPARITYDGMTYNVTSIGEEAFYNCSDLTSVEIPNSVTSIGDGAFYCSGLTSVIISNSVTSIGNFAFEGCSSLTSVEIPNSVISIGERAFYDCFGLKSVHITEIAAWCNIKFSDSASNPLYHAQHLFMNGKEIKDLVIPSSVTSIGGRAFINCPNLTSITIPNSVTSIGEVDFSNCSGLTSVTIPNSVTSIGYDAFSRCVNMTDVYCYARKVPTTDDGAFMYQIEYATLYVPKASINAYKTTEPWSGFGTIVALPEPALRGDVNGDGVVNGTDIQAIINLIVESQYDEKGDVNEDGVVNGTDIQEVINIIVNAE